MATPTKCLMNGTVRKDQQVRLADQVQVNWPTATEQDAKNNAGPSQYNRNTPPLNVAVGLLAQDSPNTNGNVQELWLTPRANETDEDPKKFSKRMGDRNPNCAGTLKAQVKTQGKLNPDWVEQLQGLPVGWTALDYLETV